MTNKITTTGSLGRDAELKFTNNTGRPVLNFDIGDGRSRRTENGDWEEQRPTIWHRITVWGALAEMWANSGLLVKGATVDVTGELTIREYEHNGEKRWQSQILADQIGVREPRNNGGGQRQQSNQYAAPAPADQFGSAIPGGGGFGGSAFGDAYNATPGGAPF